jgi:outer membrane protein assembly factor BamB
MATIEFTLVRPPLATLAANGSILLSNHLPFPLPPRFLLVPPMRSYFVVISTLVLCTLACGLFPIHQAVAEDWQQWRGNDQTGVAPGNSYPTVWSETGNILWQATVPGSGGSTPVIAGKQVFLTSGVDGKNSLHSFDLASGKPRWATAIGDDRGGKHRKGSGANPSAVTDGELTFAYFRSGDVAAVDNEGEIRWHKNLQEEFGEDTLWWDLGTSPLLTEKSVVIAVMQTGPSYLVALDKASGDVIWKTDRILDAPEEAAQSYATPLETTVNGKGIIAVMGADHLTLHALEGGKELARLGGFNPGREKFFRSIASPVISGDVIVCPYSRGATLTGVSMSALLAGKGEAAILWNRDDIGSDVPTPAARDGRIYVCGDKTGVVTAIDAKTGKTIWELALPPSRHQFSSSPLIAGDALYVTRENAATYVIGPLSSDQPKLISTNELADDQPFTVASLVPIDGSFVLRTKTKLYRIAAK